VVSRYIVDWCLRCLIHWTCLFLLYLFTAAVKCYSLCITPFNSSHCGLISTVKVASEILLCCVCSSLYYKTNVSECLLQTLENITLAQILFLVCDGFIERIVALLPWCSSIRLSVCLSVRLSGMGMHCDHSVQFSTDLTLQLDNPMFWAPWHQRMSTYSQLSFCSSTWKTGMVWMC